jgi:hypothetical protein
MFQLRQISQKDESNLNVIRSNSISLGFKKNQWKQFVGLCKTQQALKF